MSDGRLSIPVGQRILLSGHFAEPVVLESARPLGDGFECRVRLADGTPDEAILSREEAEAILGKQAEAPSSVTPADAESIRLLVESSRIRLAYIHDRYFAVSLSGIRTLPHQIEAVYLRMLPQPRLRFLLADDPGAGKTIMAGLLIKEKKLREAIDRVLILCPAPLIDALHRTLWLMENRPLNLAEFLRKSEVNRDQMRLVAQDLAGPALKGAELADISPTGELAAPAKPTANWKSLIEDGKVTQEKRPTASAASTACSSEEGTMEPWRVDAYSRSKRLWGTRYSSPATAGGRSFGSSTGFGRA